MRTSATSRPGWPPAGRPRSTRRSRWWSAAGRPARPRWRSRAPRCGCASSRWCPTGCAPLPWSSAATSSEIRRREREIVGKDTAIREIHHRVKNNLQTVAALLRLQSRRLGEGDTTAREALQEAERRIGSIAVVHETLARAAEDVVDFDEVADRVVGMVGSLGSGGGGEVQVRREGSFGLLGPEVATPLALVLVELVQNAVEHGLADRGGEVVVSVRHPRADGQAAATLALAVEDGGAGLPPGFDLERDAGLGLQIVRTLVEGELGGSLRVGPGDGPVARGTRAEVVLPDAG